MLSRRHALKLAASLPVVMPAISKADAAAALDLPYEPVYADDTDSIHSPTAFASSLDGYVNSGWLKDAGGMMAPKEFAALEESLAALEGHLRVTGDERALRLLGEMQDDQMDFATVAHWNGLRAGAAYENLRIALLRADQTCPECHASFSRGRSSCTTCGGTGVIATPGVVLR